MFSEFEIKKITKLMDSFLSKRRPKVELRKKIDLIYKINKRSIEIFTISPKWNDKIKLIEKPIAKSTFIIKNKIWKIYWQRSDLKWHSYEPNPTVTQFNDFIEILDKDEFSCF